ncbi:MAG TPA: hypothetical protein DDW87_08295, partial [Firmicutes bacterium]|nr:hypothetical protein [Bacillota bacterium]
MMINRIGRSFHRTDRKDEHHATRRSNMDRITRIREQLHGEGADVFLVSNPVNRRYLTGFTGSAGLVWISSTRQAIMTDFRYFEQVKAQCP